MAIQQTKRQSDLEKRLQLLRHQIYGGNKNQSSATSYKQSLRSVDLQLSDRKQEKSDDRRLTTDSYSATSDITYLRQDLLKIATFSSLAIGTQVFLFFLLKNHVLNLVFR